MTEPLQDWLRDQHADAIRRARTVPSAVLSARLTGMALAFEEVARHHGWDLTKEAP